MKRVWYFFMVFSAMVSCRARLSTSLAAFDSTAAIEAASDLLK
jgi:hypothetical protein